MKLERFFSENKPPFGPFHRRYKFGVKTLINGEQYGIVGSGDYPPGEAEWRWAEEEVRDYAKART